MNGKYLKYQMIFLLIILNNLIGIKALSQPIIVDHTVVDKYQDIPEYYINEVKKMWIVITGESHSFAYRAGCSLLKQVDSRYAVNVVEGGTPESYTDQHLRISRATWGNYSNTTGWIYSYGEEDWFTSALAISRTKAGITYCNTHNLNIAAIGLGWCWDGGISFTDYISATQEYIDYCVTNGYNTKIVFTTGTVDSYTGEAGYIKHLGYESIRNYVAADPARILFDYADILCYNDDGSTNTTTWNGNTYPIITAANLGDGSVGHISSAGALRLGKALWYMLARIAGWNGLPEGIDKEAPTVPTNLRGTALSVTSAQLTWTASTDNVGVTGYRIYRDGSAVNTSTTTNYTDNGLSVGNSYSYTVTAYDAAGNESSQSQSIVVIINTISASAGIGGTINPVGTILIEQGSNQIFDITADSDFRISDVIVDNISMGAVSSYTFTNVTSSHTITASFLPINMPINLSNIALNKPATAQSSTTRFIPSNGNDADSTNNSYWQGIPYPQWWKVDLEAVYDISLIVIRNYVANNRYYHYNIEASVDDQTYTQIAAKTNNNVPANAGDAYSVRVTARYLRVNITYNSANIGVHLSDFRVFGTINPDFPTIISSAGTGGAINPVGATSINSGSTQDYTISVNTGYKLSDVLIDGVSVGAVSGYQFSNVTSNHTIAALFTSLSNIALNKPAMAQSSTTRFIPSNGNDTDGTNSSYWQGLPYPQWWKVDLEAVYDISQIVIRNYVANNRYYHYNIEASNDDQTYTQIAAKTNNNVPANAGDNYSVNTTARYLRVNMTYNSANTGVHISDFKVYGTVNPDFHTVISSAGTGGTINPVGVMSISSGSAQDYTISVNTGYKLSDVLVDGVSVGAVSSYQFSNVTSNHTIAALFTSLSNIALNKPATAQSSTTRFIPSKGNDTVGTNSSYWQGLPYPRWWKVDLEAVYDITSIVIRNYVANNRYYHYNIEASTDDQTYTQIAVKENNNVTTNAGDAYSVSATARYLRVNMTYNSANIGVHISDFRVYGSLSETKKTYTQTSLSPGQGKIEDNFRLDLPEWKLEVNVYPNPFTYTTILSFSNPEKHFYTLYLRDLSGKTVKMIENIKDEMIELNRDDIPAGLYLIELRGPYIYRGKVVIE